MKFYFSGINKSSLTVLRHAGCPPIMPQPIHTKDTSLLQGFNDIFSDSGAYTIIHTKAGSFDLDSYADKYIDYINSCPKHAKFIELDVENNGYSMKKVDQIYSRLCNTGRQIIRVWHRGRGMQEWLNYSKKGNYFCISVFEKIPLKTLARMVYHAASNGAKVHGLGCGTPACWSKVPFYSCDASTWYTGLMKYGRLTIWNKQKRMFETYRYSNKQGHPPSLIGYAHATKGVIESRTTNPVFHKTGAFCVAQYLAMQKAIKDLWAKRGIIYND